MNAVPPTHPQRPLIGVLALQGDFAKHRTMLELLGAEVREVRTPAGLEGLDALVLPGGESTTMTLGIAREGLGDPLRAFAATGRPMLGTCAGLIMLDREHLGIVDIRAERNAFGRQVRSFEAPVQLPGVEGEIHAIFIRAPWIAEAGEDVEILAEVDGHPIAARQGAITVVSFHPEITGDSRLHAAFVEQVRADRAARQSAG